MISHQEDHPLEHPQLFWLLWCAKEAIFKAHRHPINFIAKDIPVKLKQENDFLLFAYGNELEGLFEVTDDYILAICSNHLDDYTYQISRKEKNITNELRSEINAFFDSRGQSIHVGSDDLNLPILLPGKDAISISHHGQYGAFAFPKSVLLENSNG